MRLRYACGVLLSCLTLTVAAAETVILQANESPPYWSKSRIGGGLGSELVQAISAAAGLQTRIDFVPLTRMIEDRDNNDLGNPEFYIAQQEFAAIIPIAISEAALFYYRPRFATPPQIDSFEDLKHYRLGVLKGALVDRNAFERWGLHFESSYTQASLFKKLKAGRLDLVFEIDLVGQHVIAQAFPTETKDFVRQPLPNSMSPIAIMLDAEYPDATVIAKQYQQGLATIIANGRYQAIVRKYYPNGQLPATWFETLQRFQQLYAF